MNGCFLFHSFDLVLPMSVANGTATFGGVIPNDPNLVGRILYVQTAAGTVASNGGEIFFGTQ